MSRILEYRSTDEENYTGTQGLIETLGDQRSHSLGVNCYKLEGLKIAKYIDGIKTIESFDLAAIPTGYIAYYKMNDNAENTVIADSGGNYNGIASFNTDELSTFGVNGEDNGAIGLNLTTSSQSINISAIPTYLFDNTDFAVATFLYTSQKNSACIIADGTNNIDGGWGIYIGYSVGAVGGEVTYTWGAPAGVSYIRGTTDIADSKYNHVVCNVTTDTSNAVSNICDIFVNTVKETTNESKVNPYIINPVHSLYIGARIDATGYFLAGRFAQFLIYPRHLTQQEIENLAIYGSLLTKEIAIDVDDNFVYVVHGSTVMRLILLNKDTLLENTSVNIGILLGNPRKIRLVGTKAIYNTVDKLYSCNSDGTDCVDINFNGNSFTKNSNNFIYTMVLDTVVKIKKYNTSLVEQSSTDTTLATDTVDLDWFAVDGYVYSLIQSATDNDTKLLRFNTVTEVYDTLLLPVAYNTATKFVKEITNAGNFAHIFTTSGVHYRIDLNAFASAVAVKRNSTTEQGGVVTIQDDFVSAENSLIFTSGWGDNPQGV